MVVETSGKKSAQFTGVRLSTESDPLAALSSSELQMRAARSFTDAPCTSFALKLLEDSKIQVETGETGGLAPRAAIHTEMGDNRATVRQS